MTKKSLTKKEISAIVDLLKIFIPEDEIEQYTEEFDDTLDYENDTFSDLESSDLESSSEDIGLINIFKKDESVQGLSLQSRLEALEGHVIVQRVVRR